MIDLFFAAVRRTAPIVRDHARQLPRPAPLPSGILTRDELRRAVAEVIG